MTISDTIMVFAVLFAPFIAVFAQRELDIWREQRQRKLNIFKTLMATRGLTMAPEHVKALNMIELEFNKRKEKPIIDAWKEYHDHLYSLTREKEKNKESLMNWTKEKERFLINLLSKMSNVFSYNFDKVQIKKGGYAPKGYTETSLENDMLRRFAIEWFLGERNVAVSLVPKDEEAGRQSQSFVDSISNIMEGQKKLKVEIVNQSSEEVDPLEK